MDEAKERVELAENMPDVELQDEDIEEEALFTDDEDVELFDGQVDEEAEEEEVVDELPADGERRIRER